MSRGYFINHRLTRFFEYDNLLRRLFFSSVFFAKHLKIYYFCHIIVPFIGDDVNICAMNVAKYGLGLELNILKCIEIHAVWGAGGMPVI